MLKFADAATLLPTHLGRNGRHLTMDGIDLVDLAVARGTPLFAFSERRLRRNATGFLAAARSGHARAQVFFASKACSNLKVLKILRECGLAIEVNSGGELYKAELAGFQPSEIVFNGVAKSEVELGAAIERGIKSINVDSAFELQRIADVAEAKGRRATVTLRLVPGVAGGTTPGIQTGSATSKFGMTAEELEEALGIALRHAEVLDVAGLHIHIGSQVTELAAYHQGVAFAAEQTARLARRLGQPLRHVNLGGGYPISYSHGPAGRNEIDQFGAPMGASAMVADVASVASSAIGRDVEILFEPGRAIVGDAAVLLTRIESCRRRGDQNWLYLDAGYNLLLDAVAVRWYYEMINAGRMDEPATSAFRVVGPLCDSADCFFDVEGEYLLKKILARLPQLDATVKEELRADMLRLPATRNLPESTRPGDLIGFLDVGAYTLSEMFQYCGRLKAAAVLIHPDGSIDSLRVRDRFEDLVAQELAAE